MKTKLHELKKHMSLIFLIQTISYLRKWVNAQYLDLQKQKRIRKQFLTYWVLLINRETNMTRKGKENFIKNYFDKQRREKYKRNHIKPSPRKQELFHLSIVLQKKIIVSVRHTEK